MPVDTTHTTYNSLAPQWQRLRDAFAGKDAVKSLLHRETYVPRLEGQDGEWEGDYDKYMGRALWTGYSARTLTGLVGAVFRKEPLVDFPEPFVPWLNDVTLTGQTLTDFARGAFKEAMAINWAGILVDMPVEGSSFDERRPYLSLYRAEDITNWRIDLRDGRPTLTQVVLRERIEEPAADGFGTEEIEQYRVLELSRRIVPSTVSGGVSLVTDVYTQQLWRIEEDVNDNPEWVPFGPPIIPDRKGESLASIPFFPISANGPEFRLEPSRLLDLVDVNYDHFRLDADYKHGLHFTALPTAWVAGFATDADLRIGSQAAWISDNPAARAGFLEFSGAGLGTIATAKESDEKMMAVLGARLLEESKRAVEAAETVQLRQAGEESIVKTAARALSSSLSKALWVVAWWAGQDNPTATIALNTDIVASQMSPGMLTALMAARQADTISERTFLEALVSGEIIQGRTWEEEQELIAMTRLPELPVPAMEEDEEDEAA